MQLRVGGIGIAITIAVMGWQTTRSSGAPESAMRTGSSAPPPSYAAARDAPVDRGSASAPEAARTVPAAAPTAHVSHGAGGHHHGPVPSNLYPRRQGPVAELAQRFAGESRGPGASADEARLRAPFARVPTIPPALVPSFECRRSVCRAELRWEVHLGASYNAALMRAVGRPAASFGIEEAGEPDADGYRPVTVYIGLAPPSE